MINIMHMSDVHFKNSLEEKRVLKKLCDDINALNIDIDLLIISGDLINKGGLNFASLEDAFLTFEYEFIDTIVRDTNIKRDRIFICPGNHDIDKNNIKDYIEKSITEELKRGQDNINLFMDDAYKDINNGINRIKSYKEFEESFYDIHKNKKITNFESSFILEVKGKKVGISSLNSCWRCYDKTEELFLGQKQLENSYEYIRGCDLKIAIMHHSFEFLNGIERKSVKGMIEKKYDYLFLGHVHSAESYQIESLAGSIFTSIAQSHNISNQKSDNIEYSMGYTILEIDEDKLQTKFRNRRYAHKSNQYVNNVDILGDVGYKIYQMPTDEEKTKYNKLKQVADGMHVNYMTGSNEHLLSFSTDSKAPKNINDIYVHPRIIKAKEYDLEQRYDYDKNHRERLFTLEEIINNNENVMIIGSKESGKTILLDKISIELSENFSTYNKIPIKIEQLSGANIERYIQRELRVSSSEFTEILAKNKIILIIDDLDYTADGKRALMRLKSFINKYPQIKIICACKGKIDKELPIEIIKDEVLNKFNHFYIDHWKSEQIKSLIDTWFLNSDKVQDVDVNDIISIFRNIKMTITPLNISMFLWVIEHQSNYKLINDAKLIECFFEHLLQKLEYNDMYHDTFDYSNKIWLLASIAHEMYMNGLFRLDKDELYSFVRKYIENRKFKVNYEKIVEYLITRGILVEKTMGEIKIIVFRFECFFRFFLMQYMLKHEDFKNYIMRHENYLNFDSEIEYYTGITRDQEELLKELHMRMMNEFEIVKAQVNKWSANYDSFFETSKQITSNISMDDILCAKKENTIIRENNHKKNDMIIENVNSSTSEEVDSKNNSENYMNRLYTLWTLVAKVLRNTEEIENGELKNIVYKDMMECSLIFAILYKLYIDAFIESESENEELEENRELIKDLKFTSLLMPIAHQELLGKLIGTLKLEVVIKEEVDKIINDLEVSELEKFTSVFTLFNISKSQGIYYVEKLSNISKRNYISDMIFLKIMHCYRTSEIDEVLDRIYLNIMGDIEARTKYGLKNRNEAKGNFISKLEDIKLLEQSVNNQLRLAE